jgi:hypothetical protein
MRNDFAWMQVFVALHVLEPILQASRLAGKRKGFVYWRPGLVARLRVGSPLIFRLSQANRRKKLQP